LLRTTWISNIVDKAWGLNIKSRLQTGKEAWRREALLSLATSSASQTAWPLRRQLYFPRHNWRVGRHGELMAAWRSQQTANQTVTRRRKASG
ncbi:MAG: hypothetical protein ACRD6N_16790, partial [Pyrinomonadaceae bacterium]